jgi:hypothetical protein
MWSISASISSPTPIKEFTVSQTLTKPKGVHLVGSIPLADTEQVFRVAAGTLGSHLKRIPDGETGERTIWIGWQARYLAEHPDLEVEEPPPGQYAPLPRFRLKDESSAATLSFASGIGYAAAAIASYSVFAGLKQQGVIPSHVRFQVSLPTPVAPIAQFISHRDQAKVEPAYERQLLAELQQICDAIPHEELAIQWDVAFEMGMWEGIGGPFQAWFEPVKPGIIERLVRYAEATPGDVSTGFHLCYGDFGHEHFVQPTDAGSLTEVSNGVLAGTERAIDWIHIPVPRDRVDADYYAPLAELQLQPDTTLYLGLVHLTDGVEGARRRIAAAQSVVADFGVAAECGFGRRPAETVAPLMELHAEVAEPEVG